MRVNRWRVEYTTAKPVTYLIDYRRLTDHLAASGDVSPHDTALAVRAHPGCDITVTGGATVRTFGSLFEITTTTLRNQRS